jgi:hypothetical protein
MVLAMVTHGCSSEPVAPTARVEGLAIPFGGASDGQRIEGATISVLEQPELSMMTGVDGHFAFDVEVGTDVTLVMDQQNFPLLQSGTYVVPEAGIADLHFQAPSYPIYGLFASLAMVTLDESKCQIVSTVTRVGKDVFDMGAHGEPGATVETIPPLPAENGPIYFNAKVIPDRTLTETSDDGGVLFGNAPVGDYRCVATKVGVMFREVRLKCRAGVLLNASPPNGLQAL